MLLDFQNLASSKLVGVLKELAEDVGEKSQVIAVVHLFLVLYGVFSKSLIQEVAPSLILLIGASYLITSFGAEQRLNLQRQFLRATRKFLAEHLSLPKLDEVDDNDWKRYEGWYCGIGVYVVTSLNALFSNLAEGKHVVSLNIALCITHLLFAMSTRKQSVVSKTLRLDAVLHYSILLSVPDQLFTEQTARRAVITRALAALFCFESLDQIFFQVVIMGTLAIYGHFGFASKILMLPSGIFLFVVVPLEIMGLRHELARSIQGTILSFNLSAQLALVTSMVPVIVVYVSFVHDMNQKWSFEYVSTILNLVCGAGCLYFSQKLNHMVHPLLSMNNNLPKPAIWGRINKSVGSGSHYILEAWDTAIVFCCLGGHLLEALVLLAFRIGSKYLPHEYARRLFLTTQVCLFLSPSLRQEDFFLVLVSSTRAWFIFENRQFSEVAFECFLLNAAQSWLAPRASKGPIQIFGICTICVAMATRIAKEYSAQLLRSVHGADSFLDHALKQKFSSVGSAIHQVLEVSPPIIEINSILKQVLKECRVGQNSCHISSYAMQYQGGSFVKQEGKLRDLLSTIDEWIESGEISRCSIKVQPFNVTRIDLLIDWQMLKVLLCDMTRRMDNDNSLFLRVLVIDKCVHLKIESKLKRNMNGFEAFLDQKPKEHFVLHMWQTIATALGGTFLSDDTVEFPLPEFPQPYSPVSLLSINTPFLESPPSFSDSKKGCVREGFPRNLTLALVDDSVLVRKSLQQIFKKRIDSSQFSFVTGNSYEEALAFPSELINKQVDIAIFDENLEYDEAVLKGTSLAVLAREKGFHGCSILHSANAGLAASLNSAFDGFVEKTASYDVFIAGIQAAWIAHERSKGKVNEEAARTVRSN